MSKPEHETSLLYWLWYLVGFVVFFLARKAIFYAASLVWYNFWWGADRLYAWFVRKVFPWNGEIHVGDLWISNDARFRHTHVVGATGSGKTVLIEHLLFEDIRAGRGALIIDPKGDRELCDRIETFCRSIGREADFHVLSATRKEQSAIWNPCRLGAASELQTKFFHSGTYSEPYYAKTCELALLAAFNRLIKTLPAGFSINEVMSELQGISQQEKESSIRGLSLELENLAKSEWAEVLGIKPPQHQQKEISLLDITRKNEILFVDLPTEGKAVQSSRIGRILLQEIMLLSGMRKTFPFLKTSPFSVYIDEFDAFANEAFVTFLNKGRSSGFMIHMAHQTLSDLEKVSPTFKGQIMGNCNVRFVFRQDLPDDAETWARFFGTETELKQTYQTEDGIKTGAASNREVQAFRVSPDAIKELPTGTCIASIKTAKVLDQLRVPFPYKAGKIALPEQRPTSSWSEAPKKDVGALDAEHVLFGQQAPNETPQKKAKPRPSSRRNRNTQEVGGEL